MMAQYLGAPNLQQQPQLNIQYLQPNRARAQMNLLPSVHNALPVDSSKRQLCLEDTHQNQGRAGQLAAPTLTSNISAPPLQLEQPVPSASPHPSLDATTANLVKAIQARAQEVARNNKQRKQKEASDEEEVEKEVDASRKSPSRKSQGGKQTKKGKVKKLPKAKGNQQKTKKLQKQSKGNQKKMKMPSESERKKLRPLGCGKCRKKPGCTPSCWRQRNYI
jgi:hypothetical protein